MLVLLSIIQHVLHFLVGVLTVEKLLYEKTVLHVYGRLVGVKFPD